MKVLIKGSYLSKIKSSISISLHFKVIFLEGGCNLREYCAFQASAIYIYIQLVLPVPFSRVFTLSGLHCGN